jgi:hypothetical protein
MVKGTISAETQMHQNMKTFKEILNLFGVILLTAETDGKNANQYPIMLTLKEQEVPKYFIT